MSNRNFSSTIGFISSFIGMAGLVLTIISLIPLNSYNLYTTLDTLLQLISFELKRAGQDEWHPIQLSSTAILYVIFLSFSFLSSVLVIFTTCIACCRHQTFQPQQTNNNSTHSAKYEKITQHKSWFLRFTCVALLIQMAASIFGTHLIYKVKPDIQEMPLEIQYNVSISCAILWISYLAIIVFSLVLLFASFCILIGSHSYRTTPASVGPLSPSLSVRRRQQEVQEMDDETRPLMIV
ncbi:uncharacterized protein ATC70_008631 [Mucor velutinosus]|uniref:Uncharacterized protein n=1 Tax=Mucor velutinosus TaxID=708070 RepID=A0AAN7DKT3_9FUNG|nr:hypothetical protein ATC70_008631 [Mucor velutinosus]